MDLQKYVDIAVGNPRGKRARELVAQRWEELVKLMEKGGISRQNTEHLYYDMIWGFGVKGTEWNPWSVAQYLPGAISADRLMGTGGYPSELLFIDNWLEQIFFDAADKIRS